MNQNQGWLSLFRPGRAGLASQGATRTRRRPSRPRLDLLEPRCLLSTLFVDDDWAGSTNGDTVGGDKTFGTDAFATIQTAINAAVAGDTIEVAAGDYTGTLVVNKALTIQGAGSASVVIDVSAGAVSNAINITSSDVLLSGFTVQGSAANSVVRYGINAGGNRTGIGLTDLVVRETSRSGINLNGIQDVTLTGIEVHDTTGAGLFLTDVKGATLTDITTSGNSWGGLGFSTYGRDYPIGVEGVVIQGTNSFGEVDSDNGGMYFEESRWEGGGFVLDNPEPITFSTDPADNADVTILSENFAYAITGPQDPADNWPVRYRFFDTLAQAESAVDGEPTHFLPDGRVLFGYASFAAPRDYHVAQLTNRTMSIQAAIDSARAGDAIAVGAGLFAENVVVDKWLAIRGAGSGADPLSSTILQPGSGAAVTLVAGGDSDADPLILSDLRADASEHGIVLDGPLSHLRLDRIVATGHTGHGLAVLDGAVVADLSLSEFDASANDAGFWVAPTGAVSGLTITNSRFDQNNHGLLVLADDASLDNEADFTGIAISGTSFSGNLLAGIYAEKFDDADLEDLAIDQNGTAPDALGGLVLSLRHGSYSGIALRNSSVTGNGSGDPAGAGIKVAVLSTGLFAASPASLSGLALARLTVTGNARGILIGDSPDEPNFEDISLNFSKIGENGAVNLGLAMSPEAAAQVDASNNWWGSNSGPGATATGGAIVSPYLVLTLSADPSSTLVGETSTITADLTHNSDGVDVSGLGVIPDGPLTFATSLGSIDPISAMLVDGVASATFSAGATVGFATLTATFAGGEASLDHEVVGPTLALSGPPTVDQGSPYTLLLTAGADAGEVLSWTIDWGDGVFETIVGDPGSATHTYGVAPAQYQISATATNALGTYAAGNTVAVAVLNVTPVVGIIGAPESVDQGQPVTLGSSVTDPGGGPYTYVWTAMAGGQIVASGDQADFQFVPVAPGEYVVTLSASDPHGGSASAAASILVLNVAPVVGIVGSPASVDQGQAVALGSSVTDPGGGPFGYTWTAIVNGQAMATGDQADFQFVPVAPGEYLVTLVVTDPHGGSATATASILVLNVAPTVEIVGAPETVEQGQPVVLGAVATDPGGGPLAYAWTVTADGQALATGDQEQFAFVPGSAGTYVVTLVATDAQGAASTSTVSIQALNLNPVAAILNLPTAPESGTPIDLQSSVASPVPGAVITYAWTAIHQGAVVASSSGPNLLFTPLLSGDYFISLTVSDGLGRSSTTTTSILVTTTVPPAVEAIVQADQQRLERTIERQNQQIATLTERFGENPPPVVQRAIQRIERQQVVQQIFFERRVARLQRFFRFRAR